MDAPEPIERPHDGPFALWYDRDTDQWTADIAGIEVTFEPGVRPNQADLRDGIAAANVPQFPN